MDEKKLKQLKQRIKIKTLAEEAGTDKAYLSNILTGRDRCSYELAKKLAMAANKLTFTYDYLPEDFRKD
jgi:transcriptional regulator with XRE-family HTH domain